MILDRQLSRRVLAFQYNSKYLYVLKMIKSKLQVWWFSTCISFLCLNYLKYTSYNSTICFDSVAILISLFIKQIIFLPLLKHGMVVGCLVQWLPLPAPDLTLDLYFKYIWFKLLPVTSNSATPRGNMGSAYSEIIWFAKSISIISYLLFRFIDSII